MLLTSHFNDLDDAVKNSTEVLSEWRRYLDVDHGSSLLPRSQHGLVSSEGTGVRYNVCFCATAMHPYILLCSSIIKLAT